MEMHTVCHDYAKPVYMGHFVSEVIRPCGNSRFRPQ